MWLTFFLKHLKNQKIEIIQFLLHFLFHPKHKRTKMNEMNYSVLLFFKNNTILEYLRSEYERRFLAFETELLLKVTQKVTKIDVKQSAIIRHLLKQKIIMFRSLVNIKNKVVVFYHDIIVVSITNSFF